MNLGSCSRRDFLTTATAAAAAAAILPLPTRGAGQPAGTPAQPGAPSRWPIGCHSRPFKQYKLSPDGLFDAVKSAGYVSADMMAGMWDAGWSRSAAIAPDYASALRDKLAARGLRSTVDSMEVAPNLSFADACAVARKQIGCAQALGQRHLLTLGGTKPQEFIPLCKVLSYAAAYGQDRGVQIVIKQHEGLNRTALELLGWAEQVGNPNFGLFYDAGNVIYYTGDDPVEQIDMVASRVNGVVAKDCTAPQYEERRSGDPGFGAKPPNPHGDEVMIEFGTGKVDFAGLFRKLKSVGFSGPVMVEGVAVGANLQETITNARANREYLDRVFAQI